MKPLFLYLHGLNSSPASLKAQETMAFIKSHSLDLEAHVPALSTEPNEVVVQLTEILSHSVPERPVFIVGSSLGGYLGTWLHNHLLQQNQERNVRLVVINPAVNACERFEEFLGPQENVYTGEKWELTHAHAEQLEALEVDTLLSPESILLLAQTADEVLDYRLAVEKYKDCYSIVQEGGNHSFENYDQILPAVFSFLMAE